MHEGFAGHSHQITNVYIDIDGDTAGSEAYVTVALRQETDAGAVDAIVRGRYIDRWSRRDGRWAIDHRVYLNDLATAIPVPADEAGSLQGARDRTDPSYGVLA